MQGKEMRGTDMHRQVLSVAPGCTGPAAACAAMIVYLVSSFGTAVSMRQVQI